MTGLVSRRSALMLACAAVGTMLAACGKKGQPLPPPGESSDFPHQYPNPTKYPHPELGSTRPTTQNPPPEQSPQSDITNSTPSGTSNPGMNAQ